MKIRYFHFHVEVSHSLKYTKYDGQMRKEETESRDERKNMEKCKLGCGG